MQLLVAVVFALVYKILDHLVHMPFTYFVTFAIDKPRGFSDATCCSVFGERVSMLLSFMLLEVPLLVLFAFGMQWAQEYLFLVCFFVTGIARLILLYLYPVLVAPLLSGYEDLPDEHKDLRGKIFELASRIKYRGRRIVVGESNIGGDLYSNAAASSSHIEISKSLLERHKGHEDEILAILGHEFGHWYKMHHFKTIPMDTLYMCVFAKCATTVMEDDSLLIDFGFT